jgi:glycosyltransferase involved in cell wall biosynthesis
VLDHERSALLVPETEVTEAIGRLLADDALRRDLGHGARRAIETRGYTWSANAVRVESTIREVFAEIGFKSQSVPIGG